MAYNKKEYDKEFQEKRRKELKLKKWVVDLTEEEFKEADELLKKNGLKKTEFLKSALRNLKEKNKRKGIKMKKIYRIEEENSFNGGVNFDSYDEAIETLNRILNDEANYMYNCNKKNIYSLCEINIINEDEDNYEEEYLNTIISLSVKEYHDMSYDEKKEKGLY